MAAAERRRRGRGQRIRPGSIVGYTGDEQTLIGEEEAEEVQTGPVVRLSDEARHRHYVQDRTLLGLMFLLGEVLVLGVLAMAGVASHWFDGNFAIQVLVITVTPSFTAWLLVVRWAFRQATQDPA